MSTIHSLKADTAVFRAAKTGAKKAEVRYDDRGYKVGDLLLLQETKYSNVQMTVDRLPLVYTGQELTVRITHIQTGYGLPSGMVVLSFEHPTKYFQD